MKSVVQKILFLLAQAILKKYRPDVVGVTGTVGKTTTRDAIAVVMKSHFRVHSSYKSFNNAFGVPFTIFGITEYPKRSFIRWAILFGKVFWLLIRKDARYPQMLVLEMGADAPGDIDELTRLAPCNRGIITAISPVHLEKYGSFAALEREKKKMYENLDPKRGWAIINADDEILMSKEGLFRARARTYGFGEKADVRAENYREHFSFRAGAHRMGMSFDIHWKDERASVDLRAIGMPAAYAALCAAAVGTTYDIPLSVIAQQLSFYVSPKGRLRLIDGIKQTLIIDDTYNSSPKALLAALDVISKCEIEEGAKRIAVLGDMLELGEYSHDAHYDIGKLLGDYRIDLLIAVGPFARHFREGARAGGIDEDKILWFDTATVAGKETQRIMKKNDVILVKGSQGIRLDRVVREIMAEPERAEELLVRQDKDWQ